MPIEFRPFSSIPRLSRDMIITEKLDGTNAQVIITEEGEFGVASRNQLITPDKDNYGFAKWAERNKEELMKLGPGRHFGEWWGNGIQRGYDLKEKRFSLFNVHKWNNNPDIPKCCSVVPVLYEGMFTTVSILSVMAELEKKGSVAAPGFMKPEGIIIYHMAGKYLFKKTFENDEKGKGK